MPKMKTKSGAKKRFTLTARGRVRSGQAGKRHGMIKRTKKQIRQLRGTTIIAPENQRTIKRFLPYGV
jgi:large subunit ribosomal protein L35